MNTEKSRWIALPIIALAMVSLGLTGCKSGKAATEQPASPEVKCTMPAETPAASEHPAKTAPEHPTKTTSEHPSS